MESYDRITPAYTSPYYVPADYGVSGLNPNTPAVPPQYAWVQQQHLYPLLVAVPPSPQAGSINADYLSEQNCMKISVAENGKQQCGKCKLYFTAVEAVEGACRYHPGKYATPGSAGPAMMPAATLLRWSCCRASDLNEPGCRQSHHIPNPTTHAILEQFEPSAGLREGLTQTACVSSSQTALGDEDAAFARQQEAEHIRQGLRRMHHMQGLPTNDSSSNSSKDGKEGIEGEKERPIMVRHLVAKTDTLAGISLRYGVKVDDLKLANNLTSQSVFAHKWLLVPNPQRLPTPDELRNYSIAAKDGKQSIAMERFRAVAKSTREEAQYYLDESHYDVGAALRAYHTDLEWEKSGPRPYKVVTQV